MSASRRWAIVSRHLRPLLRSGDVVVATETSELPVIASYPRSVPHYANPLGPTVDTFMVDWVDLTAWLAAADPTRVITDLAARLPPGSDRDRLTRWWVWFTPGMHFH